MVTSLQAYKKFGDPRKEASMILFKIPKELQIGAIPVRVYCNKLLVEPLTNALTALIDRGFISELKEWNGCFLIRPMRGYEGKYKAAINAGQLEKAMTYVSMHSWGLAVDVNASENPLGKVGKLTPGFVKCFTDNGFDWGGTFTRCDGMHFQLAKI